MLVEVIANVFFLIYAAMIKFQFDLNSIEKALVYRKAELNVG